MERRFEWTDVGVDQSQISLPALSLQSVVRALCTDSRASQCQELLGEKVIRPNLWTVIQLASGLNMKVKFFNKQSLSWETTRDGRKLRSTWRIMV